MLITMHEELGLKETPHNQECVIIPQWVYKTLTAFNLPITAAIDYPTLSQCMSHQDMVDYLLMINCGRSIFEKRYGLFDQQKQPQHQSIQISISAPFQQNDALKLLGSINGSVHSQQYDMRYENPSDPQELFWHSFVGEAYEIEWCIKDLGYRRADYENSQNLNHVIGIVAYRLVYVDSKDQRCDIHRQLQRDLLTHCFNEGVSLETLAHSGMMDRYLALC